MKTSRSRILGLLFGLTFLLLNQNSSAHTRVDISVFYSSLAPYGEWIHYRDYGLCWRPTGVEVGWRPYTHGRWIWTDYGWTWLSDYEWGWGPFHYGRWIFDDYHGWIWVPDNVWGPAWVQWRYSDAYIGWAPLPPAARFRIGIGIALGDYYVPTFGWSFTYCRSFTRTRLVLLPVRQHVLFLRQTRLIDGVSHVGNRVYNKGPRKEMIERASGERIRKFHVEDERNFGNTRGSRNLGSNRIEGERLRIYRPEFERSEDRKPQVQSERSGRSTFEGRERSDRRIERDRAPSQDRNESLRQDRGREDYRGGNGGARRGENSDVRGQGNRGHDDRREGRRR